MAVTYASRGGCSRSAAHSRYVAFLLFAVAGENMYLPELTFPAPEFQTPNSKCDFKWHRKSKELTYCMFSLREMGRKENLLEDTTYNHVGTASAASKQLIVAISG